MTILFPPVLESQALAFPFSNDPDKGTPFFEIVFPLPGMVNESDIKHLQVSLKYANTGAYAINKNVSPDGQVLYIAKNSPYFEYNNKTDICKVKIPYFAFAGGTPNKDTTYLVQVRFCSNSLWLDNITGLEEGKSVTFANWRRNSMTQVPSYFGEWSNIQKAYCYQEGTHEIDYSLKDFLPEITWTYSAVGDDPIAQAVIYYSYDGFDGRISKTQVFNGGYNSDNVYTMVQTLDVAPVASGGIEVRVEAVTKNNAIYTDEMIIPSVVDNISEIDFYKKNKISDVKLNNDENDDGIIAKQIKIGDEIVTRDNYFDVYRFNTLDFSCVKIIEKQSFLPGETVSFRDFTAEMGEDYQYVIVIKTVSEDGTVKTSKMAHNVKPIGPKNPAYGRLMRMEYSFLTSKRHQLRLMGNVQISNLKVNTQDNFQTTLGAKYPFYSRASKMNYRTFSLQATISVNFDPTSTFIRLDTLPKMTIGQRISEKTYKVLIAASPGLAQYFEKRDEETYAFVYKGGKLTAKQVEELVNRCASTLLMNGLWWEDDATGNSVLLVQDRDLIQTQEISLSRKRAWENRNKDGEKITDIGEQINFYKIGNKGTPEIPVFNGQPAGNGARTHYDDFLHRFSDLGYGTIPTDQLIFVERKFREKVMEWLADGRPKLFRSETEGNLIVVLSGVNFSPLLKNRMVYSLSATVTEIAQFNTENLLKYDLIPSKISSSYIGGHEYEFIPGHYDPEVVDRVFYLYDSDYDIPNMRLDDPDSAITIDTYLAAIGIPPFTFSNVSLPKGFDIDPIKGKISGYPEDPGGDIEYPIPAGTCKVKVTDSGNRNNPNFNSAEMEISHGIFYKKLTTTKDRISLFLRDESGQPVQDTVVVGQQIAEVESKQYFQGGVEPYTFYGMNFPSGIMVTKSTGTIHGQYLSEFTSGSDDSYKYAKVICRDAMGQEASLEVELYNSKYELMFVKLNEFDYDYTEVNTAIPEKCVAAGVYGGQPPYVFSQVDSMNMPEGWVIVPSEAESHNHGDRPAGTIYGIPTKDIDEPGEFGIQVTDALGQTKFITIGRQKVLKEFKFIYKPEYDIDRDENGQLMSSLALHSILKDKKINIEESVQGGLPFEGDYKYQFSETGLAPNFKITKLGELIGKASTPIPKHQAILYVTDRRGKKVPMTGNPDYTSGSFAGQGITVVAVEQGLKFERSRFIIKSKRVNDPITKDDIISIDFNGQELPMDSLDIPLEWFSPESALGTNGMEVTTDGFPNGISLNVQRNATSDVIERIYFVGFYQNASNTTTNGKILFQTENVNLTIPVEFGAAYDKLQKLDENPYTLSGEPGQEFSISLKRVKGGVPPFKAEFIDPPAWFADNVKLLSTNIADSSCFYISGRFPTTQTPEQTFQVKITDSQFNEAVEHESVILEVAISQINAELKINFTNNFQNVKMLQTYGAFAKEEIFRVTGGTPPYNFTFSGEIPGNFSITMDSDTGIGYIDGQAKKLYSIQENKSQAFSVTDTTGREVKGKTPFYFPQVIQAPYIGEKYRGGQPENVNVVSYNFGVIPAGTTFSAQDIFMKLGFPNIEISHDPYPYQITGFWSDNYSIEGIPYYVSNAPIEFKITLKIPTSIYQPTEVRKVVNCTIQAISGDFTFKLAEGHKNIDAVGLGNAIKDFDLSGALSGGVGPFVWSEENLPEGLHLQVDPKNTRICLIVGTPTKKMDSVDITIKVTDKGNNDITKSDVVIFNGVYDKLVVTGSATIPSYKVGDTIAPIDLNPMVSGGVPPYVFSDPNNLLGSRGLNIAEGIIQGDCTNPGNETAGTLQVRDTKGQTADIPIRIGKFDGPLNFIPSTPGVIASINPGKVGTTLPAQELLDLSKGATGGTPPYTFSEVTSEEGWSTKGWTCTMDATGKFSSIKRPASPCPAGFFRVGLSDAEGSKIYIDIPFGEVTE